MDNDDKSNIQKAREAKARGERFYLTFCRKCDKETEHYSNGGECKPCRVERKRERLAKARGERFYLTFCRKCDKETEHYSSAGGCKLCMVENSRKQNRRGSQRKGGASTISAGQNYLVWKNDYPDYNNDNWANSLWLASTCNRIHGNILSKLLGRGSTKKPSCEVLVHPIIAMSGRIIKTYTVPMQEGIKFLHREKEEFYEHFNKNALNSIKAVEALLRAFEDMKSKTDDPNYQTQVYLFLDKITEEIKIGRSDNPDQRIKSLQTGNQNALEILTTKKVEDSVVAEKKLLDASKQYSTTGGTEWRNKESIKKLKKEIKKLS